MTPSWIARYVWALSGGQITPEIEHYLLWVLPLKRGNQYWHSSLLASGAKTVSSSETKLSAYERFVRQLREKMSK